MPINAEEFIAQLRVPKDKKYEIEKILSQPGSMQRLLNLSNSLNENLSQNLQILSALLLAFSHASNMQIQLDLSENNFAKDLPAMAALVELLKRNVKIKFLLILDDCNIYNINIKPLIEYLRSAESNVISLSLRSNLLDSQAIKLLSEAILTNRTLRHLDLSENGLAERDIELLAEALRFHSSITSIALENTDINDKSLDVLLDIFKDNDKITQFKVFEDNIFIDEAGKKLKQEQLQVMLELNQNIQAPKPRIAENTESSPSATLSGSASNILGLASLCANTIIANRHLFFNCKVPRNAEILAKNVTFTSQDKSIHSKYTQMFEVCHALRQINHRLWGYVKKMKWLSEHRDNAYAWIGLAILEPCHAQEHMEKAQQAVGKENCLSFIEIAKKSDVCSLETLNDLEARISRYEKQAACILKIV